MQPAPPKTAPPLGHGMPTASPAVTVWRGTYRFRVRRHLQGGVLPPVVLERQDLGPS